MVTIFLTHTPDMFAGYYGKRAKAALEAMAPVRMNATGAVLGPEDLAREAAGCQIIVSDRQTAAPAEFFDRAPDVAAFLRCAVDIRNIDREAASRNGVLVTHAFPGFAASVAELAVGFMIDLARGVSSAVLEYRSGSIPQARLGRQLSGSTLGIIGYGVIAQHLAPIALALGMRLLVTDPYKRIREKGITQVDQETLLGESDFVVCLAVATEETENLFGAAAFAGMKRSAFFINLSRGNLVDEAALADALERGLIAGAAMDVGRAPDQMPAPALARRRDVVATPHTGGLTPAAVEKQAFDTVEQVRAILAGEIPNGAVNAERATRLARLKG
ncbi:MAG TPA: NAD(P)-dependent oxidoreductase [Microvirga sp.]|jgi:D-3-phosphoglycerate dehydrogenase|nr:NAD(P)-dependent oxidoreductase [Microvirga sp.]